MSTYWVIKRGDAYVCAKGYTLLQSKALRFTTKEFAKMYASGNERVVRLVRRVASDQ